MRSVRCPAPVVRVAGLVTMVLAADVAGSAESSLDFNRDVRPILSHNCFACHGPDEHDRREIGRAHV